MVKKAAREPELIFEEALEQLEQVVDTLERGDLALSDSLESFQKGIGLLHQCINRLNNFEEQVEVLLTGYYKDAPSWLGIPEAGGKLK
jgi:exodeoxyribonuclease VII small subunit